MREGKASHEVWQRWTTCLVVLGLMLGIRHATDPDHVIAVTALLTRERRLGAARPGRSAAAWSAT